MQYTLGTVTTTPGLTKIDGIDTEWISAGLTPGTDQFKIRGDAAIYDIASIASDTELHLTHPYSGLQEEQRDYQIFRDFTPNRGYGLLSMGDRDWPLWMRQTLNRIDSDIATLFQTSRQLQTTINSPGGVIYPADFVGDGGLFLLKYMRNADERSHGELLFSTTISTPTILVTAVINSIGSSPPARTYSMQSGALHVAIQPVGQFTFSVYKIALPFL